jgi:RimJ/RimL family protein N-acetyltransferase
VSLLPGVSAGAVELGLRFVPALASRGEAGDAVLALCEHAFATLGLLNLSAPVHVEDRTVLHWLEACGFADQGESARYGACARTYTLDNGTWQLRAVDMFPADTPPPR